MFPNAENLPRPASPGAAKLGLERWREAAAALEDESAGRFAREFASDPAGRRLLEAVFGNSPFLGRCLLAELPFVQSLVESGLDAAFSALLEATRAPAPAASTADLMRALRIARRRAAVVVALADIAGLWPEPRVTVALSDFADAAIAAAARRVLREAAASGAFALKHPDDPERDSGLAIFAMGKLGGRELNYSSDIDLIVLYDPARVAADDRSELQVVFSRLTRELLKILQERTPDGYVFRTDLRLRPDPGATPPAMSMLAAETYYETLGQNWERAALIKARPVGGDRAAGAEFLAQLRPFIWRKNLDFAAIQDIHSIKRQIAAHRGGRRIAVAGHNIKLGRGGIREIEFFAQTQQLIFGGRDPSLRVPATCDALRALVAAGRVGADVADQLIDAYWFLRRVEHRLQMIDDQQTHTIPPDPAAVEGLAAFLGFDSGPAFSDVLLEHLHAVEDHYAELFEEAPALSGPGNLVFTGGEHDPDTLRTIASMGFENSERVSTVVRQWHHGRYRATGSARAREILTELVPGLLTALARTAEPDTALLRFNDFVAGLPAGVQIFSLFLANPQLLDLVARIMGSAPYLADRLARNSSLLDILLDADSMTGPPDRAELETSLADALRDARVFEDVLDIARRWTNERKFQVGMQILVDVTDGDAAGAVLSDTADVVLAAIQPAVEADFARRHGRVAGGEMCIVAYGKHGGRELMPGSDLDAVFLFDCPDGVEGSEGPRPLTPGHYFARLGQSLISAVAAPTAEGKLYDIDLRLRPSGKNSPLVPKLDGFVRYQSENAWTWEHMALTRARPVTGTPALRDRLSGVIREILTRPRDPDRLVYDVAHMRRRMAEHHRAVSIWDIKHWRGGLVDIEFIAQYLMLRHAAKRPDVLDTNTTGALARLRDGGCLAPAVADRLIETMRLWRRVHAILRLTFGSKAFREEELPEDLRDLLVQAGEAEGFDALKDKLADAAAFAHNQFVALIEEPATAAPVPEEQPREMPL